MPKVLGDTLTNDYLVDRWGDIDTVLESVDTLPAGEYTGVVLSSLEGPIFDYSVATRNGRRYERDLCEAIINSDYVKEMIKTKSFLGEADHPPDNRLSIHFPNVSHAIRDIREDKNRKCYIATIDILDTPNGRILETLRRYGTVLACSSRGAGQVVNKNGESIVDKYSYVFSTIDIVHYPGNLSARLTPSNIPANESLSCYDLNKSGSYPDILKSYISKDYNDVSSIEEIVSEAIASGDYNTLLEARTLFNILDICPKEVNRIEGYLTHSDRELRDSIISTLSEDLKTYKREIGKLSESLVEVSSKSSKVDTEEVERLQSELSNKDSEIKTYEVEIDQLEERVSSLLESKASLISDYENKVEDMSDIIDSNEDKISSLENDILNLKSEKKEILDEYKSIRCSQLGIMEYVFDKSFKSYDSVDEIESMLESLQGSMNRSSKLKSSRSRLMNDDNTQVREQLSESTNTRNSLGNHDLVGLVKSVRGQ